MKRAQFLKTNSIPEHYPMLSNEICWARLDFKMTVLNFISFLQIYVPFALSLISIQFLKVHFEASTYVSYNRFLIICYSILL